MMSKPMIVLLTLLLSSFWRLLRITNEAAVSSQEGERPIGSVAAIANAVCHATGKRIRDLPITPDKLLL